MGSFLFDGQDLAAHFFDAWVIGLDDLVATAVDGVERVTEAREYGFVRGILQHMDREDPESGGSAVGHPGYTVMPAYELKGVADEQHLPGGAVCGVIVVLFDLPELFL